MAFKLLPPVPGLSSYKVTYAADATSAGAAILTVAWIPNLPATVPAPQSASVAPGSFATLSGTVPPKSKAREMEIRVVPPEETGSGTLTLKINGTIHAEQAISEETTWSAVVHP